MRREAKLEAFRESYPPQLPAGGAAQPGKTATPAEFPLDQPWFREALQPGGLCARLLQDLYIAEVLLSLDASQDAGGYFRSVMRFHFGRDRHRAAQRGRRAFSDPAARRQVR